MKHIPFPKKANVLTIIVSLFFLCIIPVILVSIYILHLSISNISTGTYKSMAADTKHVAQTLDDTLEQLYQSNISLVQQSNTRKLSLTSEFLSSYEQVAHINQLREQLRSVRDASPFIDNACLYFKVLRKKYNATGYSLGSFQEFSNIQYENLLNSVQTSDTLHYFVNPCNGQKTLSIYIPTTENSHGCIMELTLSTKALTAYLTSSFTEENDYFYYTLCNNLTAITNMDEQSLQSLSPYLNETKRRSQLPTTITINNKEYFLFYETMDYSKGYLIRLVAAKPLLQSLHLLYVLFFVFILVITTGCILFFIGINKTIHRPLKQLTAAFSELEKGNFSVNLNNNLISDFSYLYNGFNHMTKQLSILIEQDYKQKLLLQKSELKQLQTQINPHFLFNSFFLLQRMIKMDLHDESIKMSEMMGIYFRYITRSHNDHVLLKEEYEHACIYANIQAQRFEGRIKIEIADLPKQYENVIIPKIIIQPILENAFLYGLDNKAQNGLLYMHCQPVEDGFHIIIEDNGDELSDERLATLQESLTNATISSNTQEMTGILNIGRRLTIFSEGKSSLSVERSKLGGLRTNIFIHYQEV